MTMFEVHYEFDGAKYWKDIEADNPVHAIRKLRREFPGYLVDIVEVFELDDSRPPWD